MANERVTNIDLSGVVFSDAEYQDDLITFSGADTLSAGTILARDTVSGNLVPFVIGGTVNGNGIPIALLTYAVEAEGAGNITTRVLISGKVRKQKLIVDADGDDSNITSQVLDQLRSFSIVAIDVQELNITDNQ